MKNLVLVAFGALAFSGLCGCSNSESDVPKIDSVAAKARPGADTPAAVPQGNGSAARRAKTGD